MKRPSPPSFKAPGTIALLCVWLLAVVVLLIGDRPTAYLAIGIGAAIALLVAAGRWTLPAGNDDPDGVLRQEGTPTQLALRGLVAAGLVIWIALIGLSFQVDVPLVRELRNWSDSVPTGLPRGGLSLFVTGTCVVIPWCALLALGARPSQLGLRWRWGGYLRLLLWIAVPLGIMAWRVATGHISIVGLLLLLLENFMLNGFPEEFVFRGVVLSFCRRYVTTDWAILIQSVVFSLFHYGVTIGEEHGRALLIIANVIATNAPFGYIFALMALRSRSIAMGTIVHFMSDAMSAVMR